MNARGRVTPAPAQKSLTAKQEVPSATVPLTEDEARALTEEVRADLDRLECLPEKLLRLHDGQAWAAMGYGSWDAYVQAEFDFTRRRANQLISHSRIIAALEGREQLVPTNEAQSRELAKIPPDQRDEVWRKTIEITGGRPTAAAIKTVSLKVTRQADMAAGEPVAVQVDGDTLAANREQIAASREATRRPAKPLPGRVQAEIVKTDAESARRAVEAWHPDFRHPAHRSAAAALCDLAAAIEAKVPPGWEDTS